MICVGTSTGVPVLKFEAFIFDFAGTLVPTAHLGPDTFRAVLDHFDVDAAAVEPEFLRFWNRVGSRVGLRQVMESAVVAQFGSVENHEELAAEMSATFWKVFSTKSLTTPEAPGATALLQELDSCPVSVALLSQVRRKDLLAQLNVRGWTRCFDLILAFEDIAVPKPNPYGHHRVTQALGVSPRTAIGFEHSPNGISAAQRAGLVTAHSSCEGEWNCALDADLHLLDLHDLRIESRGALA